MSATPVNSRLEIEADSEARDLARMNAARPAMVRDPKAKPRPPRVVSASELLKADFPPRDMLLSPWLESQSLSMIHSWRGTGKTHVAMGIAYALASGGAFLDWKASVPVPVLYLDGEMPGVALRSRLALIVASNHEEPAEGFLRFLTPDFQPDGVMPNLAEIEGQDAIEPLLGDARVIVVDNLSCLVRGGKENEGDSWVPLAEWALRMRSSGRSVIFIHHSGKGGQQRGTSKREDLLDVVIQLKRPADYLPTQGARFEIHFEKARALYGKDVTALEVTLNTVSGSQQWDTRTVEVASDTQMIELANLGLCQADIAKELGVNRSTVCRGLGKATEEGRYTPKQKMPKPSKSTDSRKRAGGDRD